MRRRTGIVMGRRSAVGAVRAHPAAGYTNTARYVVRPFGPVLAGAGQGLFLGFPFLAAGSLKAAYDLVLWRWFRGVRLPEEHGATPKQSHSNAPAVAVTAEEGR